jgi:hypothetical protein
MANEFIARRGIISLDGAQITGSLSATGNISSNTLTVTSGITGTATSASYVEYSNVAGKPALVSSSSQIVGYGIFPTTGSNQFNGAQTITGSLTVTGQVVAQTLNVQQVTSSIVYSSGSNVFGNSLSNTQQFTGSLQVTGSTHYLLGNVGVGTDNPGSTLVIRGDNYVVANSGRSLGGIDILTTSSPGAGGYGGAISLGANGSGRAAIATVQGTSDNDNQGLAFFTHGSTGASDSVESMRIT